MQGSRWGIAVVAVAAVLAGGWFVHDGAVEPTPTGQARAPVRPGAAMVSASVAPAPAAEPMPARPRPDATALSSLSPAELLRRADAGDATASCRLVVEWANCRTVQARLEAAGLLLDQQRFEAGLARLPDAIRQDVLRRHRDALPRIRQESEAVLAESTRCDGMPAADDRSRIHRWRQAALGGNIVAMRQYVIGQSLSQVAYMDYLPELMLYRRDAEAIALRAVEAGDLRTAVALAHAYAGKGHDGNGGLLNEVIDYQPVRALALYRRAQDAVPAGPAREHLDRQIAEDLNRLLQEMTPAQRGEAEAQARQARPLSSAGNETQWAMLVRGNAGTTHPDECEGVAPSRGASLLGGW